MPVKRVPGRGVGHDCQQRQMVLRGLRDDRVRREIGGRNAVRTLDEVLHPCCGHLAPRAIRLGGGPVERHPHSLDPAGRHVGQLLVDVDAGGEQGAVGHHAHESRGDSRARPRGRNQHRGRDHRGNPGDPPPTTS